MCVYSINAKEIIILPIRLVNIEKNDNPPCPCEYDQKGTNFADWRGN